MIRACGGVAHLAEKDNEMGNRAGGRIRLQLFHKERKSPKLKQIERYGCRAGIDYPAADGNSAVIGWSSPVSCMATRRAYTPPCARSVSCVPCSTTWPASNTTIASASRTVDRRCAITRVVRPRIRRCKASWTSRSFSVSRCEVASSSSKIGASLRMARAMARRCRWPPDNCTPRSPIWVSWPSGK